MLPGPILGVVYLSGQIQKPGPVGIPSNEEFTVSKAILRAGGLGNLADKKKVKVVRRTGPDEKETKEIIVNVEEILGKGRLEQDIKLESADLIIVPTRGAPF
jgi:protein involved in polysaccharide export with SLBB domain